MSYGTGECSFRRRVVGFFSRVSALSTGGCGVLIRFLSWVANGPLITDFVLGVEYPGRCACVSIF